MRTPILIEQNYNKELSFDVTNVQTARFHQNISTISTACRYQESA